jgi:hypothetical protein
MLTPFKIDYSNFEEDASPIKSDVKINVSHNKLTSQKQNAEARAKWGKNNSERVSEIAALGGESALKLGVGIHGLSKEQMSQHGKKNYKEGKGMAKLTTEERSKIGKTKGKQNLVGEIVCEKCGRKTNKGNYKQFHGENCREKKIIQFIELLPNKFTKAILKETAIRYEIIGWEKWNILHELCIYTKCIIKVERPNQFNPCWYGKNIKEINKVKNYIN